MCRTARWLVLAFALPFAATQVRATGYMSLISDNACLSACNLTCAGQYYVDGSYDSSSTTNPLTLIPTSTICSCSQGTAEFLTQTSSSVGTVGQAGESNTFSFSMSSDGYYVSLTVNPTSQSCVMTYNVTSGEIMGVSSQGGGGGGGGGYSSGYGDYSNYQYGHNYDDYYDYYDGGTSPWAWGAPLTIALIATIVVVIWCAVRRASQMRQMRDRYGAKTVVIDNQRVYVPPTAPSEYATVPPNTVNYGTTTFAGPVPVAQASTSRPNSCN